MIGLQLNITKLHTVDSEFPLSFLKTLSIAGYRGFNERRVINMAVPKNKGEGSGLTIITGANNSGKSTVIEALRARSGRQTPSFSEGIRNKHANFVRIVYEFEKLLAGKDGKPDLIESRTEVIESQIAGSSQSVHTRSGGDITNGGALEPDLIHVVPSRRGFQPYFGRAQGTLQDYQRQSGLPARRVAELSSFEMRLFDIEKDPRKFNTLLGELLGYPTKWTIDQSSRGTSTFVCAMEPRATPAMVRAKALSVCSPSSTHSRAPLLAA